MSGLFVGAVTVVAANSLLDEAREIIEERKRKIAFDRYSKERERFEQLLSRREALAKRFEGLELPEVTAAPAPTNSAKTEEIRQQTEELKRYTLEQSRKIEQALMGYHRDRKAETTVEEISSWIQEVKTPTLRTRADIILALDSEGLLGVAAARSARLDQLRINAQKLVADLPEVSGHVISTETVETLQSILDSNNESQAQIAMQKLRRILEKERQAIETIRKREAALERARKLEKEQLVKLVIAEKLRHSLEDLGYLVSSIDNTAFAKNGELYVFDNDHPDHAQILRVSEDGAAVTSTPVRIVDGQSASGALDRELMQKEDSEFDEQICNERLIKIKNRFKSGNLATLRFTAGAIGGAPGNVLHIDAKEVDEDVKSLRKQSRKPRSLKTRTRQS